MTAYETQRLSHLAWDLAVRSLPVRWAHPKVIVFSRYLRFLEVIDLVKVIWQSICCNTMRTLNVADREKVRQMFDLGDISAPLLQPMWGGEFTVTMLLDESMEYGQYVISPIVSSFLSSAPAMRSVDIQSYHCVDSSKGKSAGTASSCKHTQMQDQAIFRTRRLHQRHPQTTFILHQAGSLNDWQLENQERKAIPGLITHIANNGSICFDIEEDAMRSLTLL